MPILAVGKQQRSNTAEEILDVSEALIQSRGFSAFSYQDIADALGIRKASIHYHFPSKTDLGVAVIDRYTERFGAVLRTIASDETQSTSVMLEHYFAPYRTLSVAADKVCLCGALAGEILALPPDLRARVDRFFHQHQAWITEILERGVARGDVELATEPSKAARLVFGALQGALLVRRTTDDASQLADVIAAIKVGVLASPASRRGRPTKQM